MKIKIYFLLILLSVALEVLSQKSKAEYLQEFNEFYSSIVAKSYKGKDTAYYRIIDTYKLVIDRYFKDFGYDSTYARHSQLYAMETLTRNPEQSLEILKNNVKAAQDAMLSYDILRNYHAFGNFYYKLGYYDKAGEYYFKSIKLAEKLKDWYTNGYVYIDLGNLFYSNNQFEFAHEYYNKAVTVFEKYFTGKTLDYALSLYHNNLGLILLKTDKPEDALVEFYIAYQHRVKSSNIPFYPHSYRYFIQVFDELKMDDSVYYYFNKAILIYDTLGMYDELAFTKLQLVEFLIKRNKISDAYNRIMEVASMEKVEGKSLLQTNINLYKGLVFKNLNNLDSAIYYLNLADSISVLFNQKEMQSQIFLELIDLTQKKEDYKSTVQLYNRYFESFNSSKEDNLLKKEMDIRSYEWQKENRASQEIISRTRIIIFLQALVLLFLIIIIILSVLSVKKHRKQKKALQEMINHRDLTYCIIAHDLRGPIGSVHSGLDLIVKGIINEDYAIKEIIKSATVSLFSSFSLLENLLAWANFKSNKTLFTPEIVDTKELIEEAVNQVDSLLKEKDIKLIIDADHKFYLKVDKNMMISVIRNILSNAIKFSQSKSKIFIKIEKDKDKIRLAIIDNGVGIKKENLEKINSSQSIFTTLGTNKEKGTGLGLQIVKEFIRKNNGTYRIDSEENSGTIFNIWLPLEN